MKYFFKIN